MDAALLVEKESASVGAADHTDDTKNTQSSSHMDCSDLRQKEDCEEYTCENQEDGKIREMDEKDQQISHEEGEDKRPEIEWMSQQGTDIQEEDMSKQEYCGQELNEQEDTGEENNNTSQEDEQQVTTSALSLRQKPDGDLKGESAEHEHTELKQKDKTLDENFIDNIKNIVDEKNMEEPALQMVKEVSEKNEEMEHESSEQYQELKVTEVKEENKQGSLVGTVMSEAEGIKSDSSAEISMDVSNLEEKMEVADPEGGEPFVNLGKCSDKNN